MVNKELNRQERLLLFVLADNRFTPAVTLSEFTISPSMFTMKYQ